MTERPTGASKSSQQRLETRWESEKVSNDGAEMGLEDYS